MKTILLFGAGKSSSILIEYLGKCCDENDWKLLVCDANLNSAQSKIRGFSSATAVAFDIHYEEKRQQLVSKADTVISMLPPDLHFPVAKDCVAFSKNFLTASYLDEKIQSLKTEIDEKGLIFLGEMGLDPGIDHMSAMKLINHIKGQGGRITSFKSHCGGLVAPESDDSPWHYKITWNPVNVVRAGSAGAVYLQNGNFVNIPYEQIFNDKNTVDVPGLFPLAWYANRNSLPYINTYQLQTTTTFIRTTLRYPSFCRGWKKIVEMDFTNISDDEEIKECKTWADWFNLKRKNLLLTSKDRTRDKHFFDQDFLMQLDYLGMRNPDKIPIGITHSAALLQYLLEKKLMMGPGDKDMIVMLHEIEYFMDNRQQEKRSCLVLKGEDSLRTAMAKTVGLPLGIAAKLILQEKIKVTGLHIPVIPEIYKPVLKELALYGIKFN